jgi:hypothetical protein
MGAKLGLLAQIRPDFFAPELPAIAEFSTNETMGHSGNKSDRLYPNIEYLSNIRISRFSLSGVGFVHGVLLEGQRLTYVPFKPLIFAIGYLSFI